MSKTDTVTISRAKFERLVARIEDIEDALQMRALEESVPRDGVPPGSLPGSVAERILDGDNPLRTWREYRGMTLAELSNIASVGVSYISEMETGKKQGSVLARKKLARALGTTIDAISV